MMVNIANPIYDSVFKYLMEDERIAKTLKVNNLLDEVLSVFDQSQKEKGNHQVLSVDEDKFYGDTEMMHILHRLITAASDSKLRQDMNVEDEFFSAIENRDTAILQRDKKIAMQDEKIASQDKKITSLKEEKKDMELKMHSMVKAMFDNGMSKEMIASITKIPMENIEKLVTLK